jgi:hypothetical protein
MMAVIMKMNHDMSKMNHNFAAMNEKVTDLTEANTRMGQNINRMDRHIADLSHDLSLSLRKTDVAEKRARIMNDPVTSLICILTCEPIYRRATRKLAEVDRQIEGRAFRLNHQEVLALMPD